MFLSADDVLVMECGCFGIFWLDRSRFGFVLQWFWSTFGGGEYLQGVGMGVRGLVGSRQSTAEGWRGGYWVDTGRLGRSVLIEVFCLRGKRVVGIGEKRVGLYSGVFVCWIEGCGSSSV